MWRPATRQITGTNDGGFWSQSCTILLIFCLVPLGTRRRFGPAPVEETAPPQLAQPSPSAYPRPPQNDHESPSKRGREESPGADPKSKRIPVNLDSHPVPLSFRTSLQQLCETYNNSHMQISDLIPLS